MVCRPCRLHMGKGYWVLMVIIGGLTTAFFFWTKALVAAFQIFQARNSGRLPGFRHRHTLLHGRLVLLHCFIVQLAGWWFQPFGFCSLSREMIWSSFSSLPHPRNRSRAKTISDSQWLSHSSPPKKKVPFDSPFRCLSILDDSNGPRLLHYLNSSHCVVLHRFVGPVQPGLQVLHCGLSSDDQRGPPGRKRPFFGASQWIKGDLPISVPRTVNNIIDKIIWCDMNIA